MMLVMIAFSNGDFSFSYLVKAEGDIPEITIRIYYERADQDYDH